MDRKTEEEVKAQAEKDAAIEEDDKLLELVDVGLPGYASVRVAASERLAHATQYERMFLQKVSLEATISIGKKSGQDIKKAEENLSITIFEMKHHLRSISDIDKRFPTAKAEMVKALDVSKSNEES